MIIRAIAWKNGRVAFLLLGLIHLERAIGYLPGLPRWRQHPSYHSLDGKTNGLEEECSLESENASDCIEAQGPYYRKDTSEYLTVREVLVAQVDSLRGRFQSFENEGDEGSNMMKYNKRNRGFYTRPESNATIPPDQIAASTHQVNVEYTTLIGDDDLVLVDTLRKPGMKSVSRAFHRAGPRKLLHFNPSNVNAAIVTCGGLCPVSCFCSLCVWKSASCPWSDDEGR